MNTVAKIVNLALRLFRDARVRLGARALIAAGGAFYLGVKGNQSVDAVTVQAALTAALWAGIEVITPLNSLLGLFKQ